MDKNSNLYCTWADRGIALHNSGAALVCCQSRSYLHDDRDQKIFWHTHALEDAWNSPTRREIQDALDQGVQHPNCSACWDEENSGGTSRRQHHLASEIDYTGPENIPLLLDLKLGNLCNLSCRTCNPYVSSKWMRDWWEVFDKHSHKLVNYDDYVERTYGTGRASYNNNNNSFWTKLNEWLPHAQYIDIYGAEPMLIHKLFDVLQHSIDCGYHVNQVLHFNTNCTIWNQKYIDILGQFKRIYIDLSIDGLYKQYDYIRHGETWDVVIANLERYRQFQTAHSHHAVSICVTVSLFNIYYVDEIFNYFDQSGWRLHLNLAHMPLHVSIKALPVPVKQIIKEKLLKNSSTVFQELITPVLSYMDQELTLSETEWHGYVNGVWPEVVRSTNELDVLRQESFRDTFPEFYNIIGPYFK
jgi:MoaA/NifB/PqqE/SkfB family radical SAM enzyme